MKKFFLFACVDVAFVIACSSGSDQPDASTPIVDLRADTNRNGTIDWNDPTEDQNEDTWDQTHGAIFLANIDDDQSVCPSKSSSGAILTDVQLAQCNDAQDTVINGDSDLLDLAPLGVAAWAGAPDGTTATISTDDASAPMVHLFIQRQGALTFFDWQNGDVISTDELRAGATLAIEATDVVRDPNVWNGYTTLTLTIGSQTDVVKMRVAPMITRHHLAAEEQIFVTAYSDDTGSVALRSTLYSNMAGNGEGDGTTLGPKPSNVTEIDGNTAYGNDYPFDDQWTQDYFEVGYMSMPVASGGNSTDGKQHVIDVYIRSANIYSTSTQNPLREAGKVVFAKFRGPDAAAIQQYDLTSDQTMDSLNSFGNLETIPPYSLDGKNYPLGRLFRGSIPTFHPDASFEKMMEAQLVQPPVYMDTSWLDVGHVDETTSFVKTASNARGWTLLVNDPAMAKQMLQDASTAGNGSAVMFAGKQWIDDNNVATAADITIDEVLADTDVMMQSDVAAAAIANQLQTIQAATGVADAEIIHVPFLHEPTMGFSLAYQPGTVNALYYASDTFAAPDPHGPVINGKDIFKDQLETALSAIGIKVVWIEDWDLYHRLSGEVHCGTNSKRGLLDGEQWWASGY